MSVKATRLRAVGRKTYRFHVHIVNSSSTLAVGAKSRVNVLAKHVTVHLVRAQQVGLPVSIRSTEETETEKTGSSRMRDGVDFVKLDCDHLREPVLVGVVDDAASLHDVDGWI